MILQCRMARSSSETEKPISVGEVLTWSCDTQEQIPGDIETLKIQGPNEADAPFQLKLIRILNKTEHELQFEGAAYRVGNFTLQDFKLIDQLDRVYSLEGPRVRVESILPKDSETPPQPYEPYGAWIGAFPWTLMLGAVIFLVLVLWGISRLWKRKAAQKKLIEELKQLRTLREPDEELVRGLRQLERRVQLKQISVQEGQAVLVQEIQLYFAREFLVAKDQLKEKRIQKELKKQKIAPNEAMKKSLRRLFLEISTLNRTHVENEEELENIKNSIQSSFEEFFKLLALARRKKNVSI